MSNDTISDMLTAVRNANLAHHRILEIPATRLTKALASVLDSQGFIEEYAEIGGNKLSLALKYSGPTLTPAIKGLKRVSKPGLRVYSPSRKLPKVLGGVGVAIISTSKGIMVEREARKLNLGGEVLCYIW
jgi:small subunit ribosomal protein S8